MKELPILFSTPMVQAIQEKRKTMTRRTRGLEKVNENPNEWNFVCFGPNPEKEMFLINHAYFQLTGTSTWLHSKPHYQVGDELWVRETWMDNPNAHVMPDIPFKYKASVSDQFISEWPGYWRPSLFMPKKAARLWLEVTGVRCERLMDITDEDCEKEGIEYTIVPDFGHKRYKDYLGNVDWWLKPRMSFFSLWDSINGKMAYLKNPWVFVYEFKCINK